jgi:hypothetical protein
VCSFDVPIANADSERQLFPNSVDGQSLIKRVFLIAVKLTDLYMFMELLGY